MRGAVGVGVLFRHYWKIFPSLVFWLGRVIMESWNDFGWKRPQNHLVHKGQRV